MKNRKVVTIQIETWGEVVPLRPSLRSWRFFWCLFSFVVRKVRDTAAQKLNRRRTRKRWRRRQGGGGKGWEKPPFSPPFLGHKREFKHQRRRRLRTKTSLKKWIRAASNFMALIPSRLIRQMLSKGLDLNSKGLYQSSGKEKESCCLVFPFSTKREIKQFHVVVVRRRQRNVQKAWCTCKVVGLLI